jgi:hypothetical protein
MPATATMVAMAVMAAMMMIVWRGKGADGRACLDRAKIVVAAVVSVTIPVTIPVHTFGTEG